MNEQIQRRSINFNFSVTGIGSVPYLDIKDTSKKILESFRNIPFWSQYVKRSNFEDMSIQFSEGLPLLRFEPENTTLRLQPDNRETELVSFYDRFLSDD